MNPRTWPCRLVSFGFMNTVYLNSIHETCAVNTGNSLPRVDPEIPCWPHSIGSSMIRQNQGMTFDGSFQIIGSCFQQHIGVFIQKTLVAWSANSLSWATWGSASSPRISRETCHSRKCCYPIRLGTCCRWISIHRWSLFGCRRTLLLFRKARRRKRHLPNTPCAWARSLHRRCTRCQWARFWTGWSTLRLSMVSK